MAFCVGGLSVSYAAIVVATVAFVHVVVHVVAHANTVNVITVDVAAFAIKQ